MEEALEQTFDINPVEIVSDIRTENGLVISRASNGDSARSAAAKIYRDAPAPASCALALAESGVAALLINANQELDGIEMKCNSNAPQIVRTKHAKSCRASDCSLHLSGVSTHLMIARMLLPRLCVFCFVCQRAVCATLHLLRDPWRVGSAL